MHRALLGNSAETNIRDADPDVFIHKNRKRSESSYPIFRHSLDEIWRRYRNSGEDIEKRDLDRAIVALIIWQRCAYSVDLSDYRKRRLRINFLLRALF